MLLAAAAAAAPAAAEAAAVVAVAPKEKAATADPAPPKAPTKVLVRDKKTGKLTGKIDNVVKREQRRTMGPNRDLILRKVKVDIYQRANSTDKRLVHVKAVRWNLREYRKRYDVPVENPAVRARMLDPRDLRQSKLEPRPARPRMGSHGTERAASSPVEVGLWASEPSGSSSGPRCRSGPTGPGLSAGPAFAPSRSWRGSAFRSLTKFDHCKFLQVSIFVLCACLYLVQLPT